MGAVSGDVNTMPMYCATLADLASRPTNAKQSGDVAWVVGQESAISGPKYFFWRTTAVPPPGVVTVPGGFWAPEVLAGGFNEIYQATELAIDTAITNVAPRTTIVQSSVITAPDLVPVTCEVSASFSAGMGATATEISFDIELSINGGAYSALPNGASSISCAANKSTGAAIIKSFGTIPGDTYQFRLTALGDTATGACNPATRPTTDHATLVVKMFPTQ